MLNTRYSQLIELLRSHNELAAALRLLEWDQETFMPAGVSDDRARQVGTVAALLHDQQTAPAFVALVDALTGEIPRLSPEQAVDVRETKWRIDRVRALDTALVRARATLHAQARTAWIAAREHEDFPSLAPYLQRIVEIERQVAAAIDPSRDPYDVLLEEYEPGSTGADVARVLEQLQVRLIPLVDRLRDRLNARPLETSGLCGHFPIEAQRRLSRELARRLGFDFNRGRLDEAVHPFTTTIGTDVRLTTRYDPHDLRGALFSTIHEVGHGLYEQGLDPLRRGTPGGESCSLAIHESQSRLWENHIARSAAFWHAAWPTVVKHFPTLTDQSLDRVVCAVNEAGPSLIRTEADELTYNLHIILRFELERALVAGDLPVEELPGAWRDRMRRYLGVVPATDRDGVLQDVHWPSGAIGYFPTYALGNVYAAQLIEAAEIDLGPLDALLSAGAFDPLLHWLRRKVHHLGQTYRAPALIEWATGQAPTADPLLRHLERKVAFLETA